jgi:3-oxoacyl-[acyl-carrier-protein] synthase-3
MRATCCGLRYRRIWTSGWPRRRPHATGNCLRDCALAPSDIDLVIAAPARPAFRAALSTQLGVPATRVIVAEDEHTHTASLAVALYRARNRGPGQTRILLVAAGAGITAGAALYRVPPG